MAILLAWGCVGAWAESVQSPVGDSERAAPAVDLENLEKPQPQELTPPEIVQATAAEARKKPPVVALLDFETSTLDVGPVKAISQAVWARLKMRPDLAILPRKATRRWLIRMDLHPFTPFRTDFDMVSVAKALKVDYLIYGCVDYIGSTYLIDYSVFSAREGRLVMQDAQLRHMDLDRMVADVGEVAQVIGNRIVETPSDVIDEKETPPVESTEPVGDKKPGQASRVWIRKATVLDKPETSAETKDPAQTGKTGAASVPQPAPKIAAGPARKAFDKALTLPKNSKERLAALNEAVALGPKMLVYQRMLIDENFRQGLYPACLDVCDQALALKPGDSLLLTVRGAAHFELNQLTEARAAYEQAVASDPKNWYARYNLAQTLTVTKSPKAAQAWRDYMDVAGEDPDQATYLEEARHNLAGLEGYQGD